MRLLIDGDSLVKAAREVIIKAALKGYVCAHFVANHPLSLPKKHQGIFFYQVASGADAADDFIVLHATAHDLVITRDVILASRLLEKGVKVINDRGYQFNVNEINAKLSERLIMLKARESGLYVSPIESTYTKKELANFANCLYNIINIVRKELREPQKCAIIELS